MEQVPEVPVVVAQAWQNAAYEIEQSAIEHRRPSVLYRPRLSRDGNQWCALYGDDLMQGVAGFGPTPEAAMRDFDQAWAKDWTASMAN